MEHLSTTPNSFSFRNHMSSFNYGKSPGMFITCEGIIERKGESARRASIVIGQEPRNITLEPAKIQLSQYCFLGHRYLG